MISARSLVAVDVDVEPGAEELDARFGDLLADEDSGPRGSRERNVTRELSRRLYEVKWKLRTDVANAQNFTF